MWGKKSNQGWIIYILQSILTGYEIWTSELNHTILCAVFRSLKFQTLLGFLMLFFSFTDLLCKDNPHALWYCSPSQAKPSVISMGFLKKFCYHMILLNNKIKLSICDRNPLTDSWQKEHMRLIGILKKNLFKIPYYGS